MNQGAEKYRLLLEKLPHAFAYHQIVTDTEGVPVDYIFLEVNEAFEKMTGLKRDEVIGRKVTEVLPGIKKSGFDWIGVYGKVAMSGKPVRFENYSEPLGRWYDVSAYSDEYGYFAVTFHDITIQKNEKLILEKLITLIEENLQSPVGELNYKDLTDGLLELSGARFVAINTYDLGSNKSVTRAISGMSAGIRKAGSILGIDLVGKAWEIIPERLNSIKEGRLLRFANLYDSASGAIPKKVSALLEKAFGIGEVYVAEIGHEGKTIGDLIMFMPRGKTLEHPKAIELYAAQIGIMLTRKETIEALQASEENYRQIVDNTSDVIWVADKNLNVTYVSPSVERLLGETVDEHLEKNLEQKITPQSLEPIIKAFQEEMEKEKDSSADKNRTLIIEVEHYKADGKTIWVAMHISALRDNAGNMIGFQGVTRDIDERKRVEEALQESEMRSQALVKAIPDLLFRFNREGVYLEAVVKEEMMLNPKGRELYRQNKLIGKAMPEVLPVPIADKLMTGIEKALASGEIQVFEYSYKVEGSEHYFEARLAPIGTTEVVSIVRDITERKSHEDKLQYISFHDQLTGLYNRRYYENELKRLDNSREHPIAVISADLDGLKLINDTLGHSEGDKYLKTGAELLKGALRTSDILARVGGDEFAVVLPNTTLEVGQRMVERIRHQIEEYNRQKTSGPPISMSIGLAVSESGEHSLEETYNKADAAMYEDKKQRREKEHK